MKTKILLIAVTLLISLQFMHAQYLVSSTEVLNYSASQVNFILNYHGWDTSPMTLNGAVMYKITYNTTDVYGEPTIASGALFVPQNSCDTLPFVSWQHGTQFEKIDVPSNTDEYDVGLLYSGNGYIATLPDYLGMGDNPGHHPYIHWESEATASIDLIRAAREYLNDTLLIWDNNQLFIAGYSQGGHATMAIHKYITVNNLQTEFNVVASAPGSGVFPLYDVQLPGMLDEDSTFYASHFMPYALASYQLVYGNLYDNYIEYYDPPYDSIIADWLNSGIHNDYEWAELIPDNFYDFMQDSVLDNIKSNPNHPANVDIRENDLHNWIPQEPVRMLYCGMDSMAFSQNSIMALDTMIALGTLEVQALELDPDADHNGCFIPATIYSLVWFDSLRVDCTIVSIPSVKKQTGISLCPNPFTTSVTIEYELAHPGIVRINIYNQLGGEVEVIEGRKQKGLNQVVWTPRNIPNGIYYFRLQAGEQTASGKMMLMK